MTDPKPDNNAFPIANIVLRDKNVRSEYTNMEELTASIKTEGLIQPLVLATLPNGKGELVAGYRRYYAAKKAGLTQVPVFFKSMDEHQRHRVALIENLQRVDMNPMDRAVGIQKMMVDEELDQKGAAANLTVSEGYISQHLALLKLPAKVQRDVRNDKLPMTHARELGRLKDEDAIMAMLPEARTLTAADLKTKVEFAVTKQKEKDAKAAEKEAANGGSKKRKSANGDDAGEEADDGPGGAGGGKKSLAEQYAEAELAPLTKTALREQLMLIAGKMDAAKSEEKRAEWKYVLKGLEIAGGLK